MMIKGQRDGKELEGKERSKQLSECAGETPETNQRNKKRERVMGIMRAQTATAAVWRRRCRGI